MAFYIWWKAVGVLYIFTTILQFPIFLSIWSTEELLCLGYALWLAVNYVCASVFFASTSPSILPDILALICNWRFVLLCKSIDLRNPTILAFVSLLINFCLARDFSCVRFQWQVELNVLAWLGPPGPWVFAYQC